MKIEKQILPPRPVQTVTCWSATSDDGCLQAHAEKIGSTIMVSVSIVGCHGAQLSTCMVEKHMGRLLAPDVAAFVCAVRAAIQADVAEAA